jgi:hypothetical protein
MAIGFGLGANEMMDSNAHMRTRLLAALLIVAAIVVCVAMANALLALTSTGNPLADNTTYGTEYGPNISITPNRDPGDSWTTGYPVHAYSVIHFWVNATGETFVTIVDPVGVVVHETYAPCNFTCFAVIDGYYEETVSVNATNVTVTETSIVERLPAPASQSDFEALRETSLMSIALIGFASAISMVSFATLLLRIDRKFKGKGV